MLALNILDYSPIDEGKTARKRFWRQQNWHSLQSAPASNGFG
ncbi:hypothetical protein [Planococcus sp. 107-1]|nr:hypothetical protein [Planococcus sp. 107-1]